MNILAKCRLCKVTIDTYVGYDNCCPCGEISIDARKDEVKVQARDWANFIRVDEAGNEIIMTIKDKESVLSAHNEPERVSKPSRDDLLGMLNMMIKNIEDLPPQGLASYVTNYDLLSSLLLIGAIFRSDCKDSM